MYLFSGSASFTNTTVVGSGGASSRGGGIHNAGATLTLTNATLSDNIRGSLLTDQGATTNVANTIIANGFSDGDGDCVASGLPSGNGTTSNAITNDQRRESRSGQQLRARGPTAMCRALDPKLASLVDNGGATSTEALLAGSGALAAANEANCPATDQRGFDRANPCDIGAFEAVFVDQPSVTTQPADNVQQTQADLHADVNFSGEAGAYRLKWGTAPDALNNTTGEIGGGVSRASTPESTTINNLSPGVTYYFQAIADNATGTASGEVLQFTTQAGPPAISDVHVDSVTDTTATIDFTIDPQGNDTSYVINYGPGHELRKHVRHLRHWVNAGPQSLTKTLTNLGPSSTIHFQIVASNGVQQDVASDDQTFTTAEQLAGTVGMPFEVDDSGVGRTPAQTRRRWIGATAHSPTRATSVQPDPFSEGLIDYQVSDNHTYASPGHFPIRIIYDDLGPKPTSSPRYPRPPRRP